jgi:uncharacterized repeat protein (TIGR03803 family)
VVFKLSPTGAETILHSFTGGADGGNPVAGLILDAAGNLYGTTFYGGVVPTGGMAFKLSSCGKETVLHSFTGGPGDGLNPYSGLVRDAAGNLYGVTNYGGSNSCEAPPYSGCGTAYELDPAGTETILYSFAEGAGGYYPYTDSLVRDAAGSLYGTAVYGGASGAGVVFELVRCHSSPTGYNYKVLYGFTGGADGGHPNTGVIRDAAGNLYGTTMGGGIESSACSSPLYPVVFLTCGVVFELVRCASSPPATTLRCFTASPGERTEEIPSPLWCGTGRATSTAPLSRVAWNPARVSTETLQVVETKVVEWCSS